MHSSINNNDTSYSEHNLAYINHTQSSEHNISNITHSNHISYSELNKHHNYNINYATPSQNTYCSTNSEHILTNNKYNKNLSYHVNKCKHVKNNLVHTISKITKQNNHTTIMNQTSHNVNNNNNIHSINNHKNIIKTASQTQYTHNLDIDLLIHRYNRKYKQHLKQTRRQPNAILDYNTKNFTNRLFHNISSYTLTPQEENVLALGLKFSIDDWYLNETYYLNQ